MLKWLGKKLPTLEKLRNDLRINDEYFEAEPLPPCIVSESMLHTFEIPVITDKIFAHLNLNDLLACRLVHPSWLDPASDFINRHDLSIVSLQYASYSRIFHRSEFHPRSDRRNHKIKKRYTLSALNRLLKISANFPSSNFHFNGGILTEPDPLTFFTIQGSLIKSLTLRNTIFNHSELPPDVNLKKLGSGSGVNQNQDLSLPQLKTISFSGTLPSTTEKFLESAPNLKLTNIPSFDLEHDLPVFVRTGKVSTIQSFTLVKKPNIREIPGMTYVIPDVVQLVSADPRLRDLSLFLFPDDPNQDEFTREQAQLEWTSVLNDLLEVSQNTLEKLTLVNLSLCPGLISPTFKKLTHLQLSSGRKGHSIAVFPIGLNLTQSFPHLVTLDLSQLYPPVEDDVEWDIYFPTRPDLLPNVIDLTLVDTMSDTWVRNIRWWCPNIENLTLMADKSAKRQHPDSLTLLFELWPEIEQFDLVYMEGHKELLSLDPALTGMEPRVCQQLKQQFKTAEEHCDIWNLVRGNQKIREKYEGFRVGLSVFDLKRLKKFRIHCDQYLSLRLRMEFPMTWVSGLFAFGMLPKPATVRVEIVYTVKHADPDVIKKIHTILLPYVQLVCPNKSYQVGSTSA